MIAFLRGDLLEIDGEAAVVDVAGVGYQVLVSASTAAALAVGPRGETRLYVHTHFVKDEPLRLYGFTDVGERSLFQTLISVQGSGRGWRWRSWRGSRRASWCAPSPPATWAG